MNQTESASEPSETAADTTPAATEPTETEATPPPLKPEVLRWKNEGGALAPEE